jgi:hypothetical protein
MKNLYVFANGKYFGYYHVEVTAAELRNSVAINNGFDISEISTWESSEDLTLEDIQKTVDPKTEMMEVIEGAIQIVNAPLGVDLVTEYNDMDTGKENFAPEYIRTVLRSHDLDRAE